MNCSRGGSIVSKFIAGPAAAPAIGSDATLPAGEDMPFGLKSDREPSSDNLLECWPVEPDLDLPPARFANIPGV
jgi:hypothetical protein